MAGNGVAFAVAQSELGIAKEVTVGIPVAPAFWIPTKSPKYKPDQTMIPDDTLQGSMVAVYSLTQGMRYDAHGWDAYPYLDSFPLFLMAELGSADTKTTAGTATTLSALAAVGATTVSVTATVAAGQYIVIGSGGTLETHLVKSVATLVLTLATPLIYAQPSGATVTPLTQHQFSLLNNAGNGNQPPSMTITDFDGDQWRQLSAAQLDQLTLKGNGTGFVDYTCSWFANPSITPSAPSPSFTSVRPPPGWTLAVSIGGTLINYVETWEMDFKRGVKPTPALTGTREYYNYFANTLQATGKITVVETSGAPQLTQYLNGATEALDFTLFDVNSGYALNLHSSQAMFKTGELDRSKEGPVMAQLEFQMIPSTTDALAGGVSPVIATVANAQSTTY